MTNKTIESGKVQGKPYEVGKGKPPIDTRFGGKRANRQGKGRPKNMTQLRKLAQSIACEELQSTDNNIITRIEALLRVMSTSRNPADRKMFLEYTYGKVKDEIEHHETGEIVLRVIREETKKDGS